MRLDQFLLRENFFDSREKARQAIVAGGVQVNGALACKPAQEVTPQDLIEVERSVIRYVSRGGIKLERAIVEFNLIFENKTVLDVGASTGGFTDCALQHGAARVIAVDVGKNQLHESLRKNPNVVSLEETDIRTLSAEQAGRKTVDFIVADVSFISAKKVLLPMKNFLSPGGEMLLLVKPQFEQQEKKQFKGGIIKDEINRRSALEEVVKEAKRHGFQLHGVTETAAGGSRQNIEYLTYFIMGGND